MRSDYENFQTHIPTFVRSFYRPVKWNGKSYKYNDHFPWQEMNVPYETAKALFYSEQIYHNPDLEKQTQVGDRLQEMELPQLEKVVLLLNTEVKKKTVSKEEYTRKRVRQSKIRDRQVGLIRQWLRNNEWAHERFYELRDEALKTETKEED